MPELRLHYRVTGHEFLAATEAGEIVEVRTPSNRKIGGSVIVYADGGTVAVVETELDVRIALAAL